MSSGFFTLPSRHMTGAGGRVLTEGGAGCFACRPALSNRLALRKGLYHGLQALTIQVVRSLRQSLLRMLQRLFRVALGRVAARQAHMHGPCLAVTLLVELKDRECFIGLLGVQQ